MTDINSLTEAVTQGDWDKARHLLAIRVAEMVEKTDSPRETKALSISLNNLIDACEEADVTSDSTDTPLAQILREAEEQKRRFQAEREEAIARSREAI